jgi:molybdopterin molybdotransferase
MLTVEEALDLIEAAVRPLSAQRLTLTEALGLILAENIVSDSDSPPFDKALMDGFAIRAADQQQAEAQMRIVGELTAGQVPTRPVGLGEAMQIMTGAPIPDGADVVVRIEDATIDGDSVRLRGGPMSAGRNILRRGTAMRTGEVVMPAGRRLRAQELGLLAELGRGLVSVIPKPTVALLATGDELVAVDQVPGPGQIRNSNEAMLHGQVSQGGCVAVPLGIARDDERILEQKIREGLECDVLCLSGGVSMGKLDLVPSTLARCGVREVFHKVHMKPGKPVWFGVYDGSDDRRRSIFGLPGNPVSSMVCCELFVQTAIRILSGQSPSRPVPISARLATAHSHHDDRPTFVPSYVESGLDGPRVTPVGWKGSADLRSTVDANAMTLFPPGTKNYTIGDVVDVYPW